jgi:hypothetical protein
MNQEETIIEEAVELSENPVIENLAEQAVVPAENLETPETAEQLDDDAESTEECDDDQQPTVTQEQLERLVAEAEERGYLRGRNESIAELMKRPGMFERADADSMSDSADSAGSSEVMILNNLRPSVWD